MGNIPTIGIISTALSSLPLLGTVTLVRLMLFALVALLLSQWFSAHHNSYFIIPIIGGVLLQAVLAIYQFLAQKSIGLGILGEQMLGSGIDGVAKLDIGGTKIIRAYGTLPHPNVLAAFLIIGLMLASWKYLRQESLTRIQYIAWLGAIALLFVAELFTFSRSGWEALAVAGAITGTWTFARWRLLSEETQKRFTWLCGVLAVAGMLATFFLSPYIRERVSVPALEDQAVQMRLNGFYAAVRMIDANRFFGIGPGQFTTETLRIQPDLPELWMYQPVHTIYALIAAEYGLLGLLAFFFFIGFVMHTWWIRRREAADSILHIAVFSVFTAYLTAGLFDHFFFTFELGVALFWIAIALMLAHNSGVQKPVNPYTR